MTWRDIFENDVPDMHTEGRKRWVASSGERHESQKVIHIAQLCPNLLPTHRNPDCELSNRFDH